MWGEWRLILKSMEQPENKPTDRWSKKLKKSKEELNLSNSMNQNDKSVAF